MTANFIDGDPPSGAAQHSLEISVVIVGRFTTYDEAEQYRSLIESAMRLMVEGEPLRVEALTAIVAEDKPDRRSDGRTD